MEITEIKPKLNIIAENSVLVKRVNDHTDELFTYINHLPQSTKQQIFAGYGNHNDTGPIIDIRTQVAKQLLSGDIDKQFVIEAFNEGKKSSPKQFAPFGNLFSLLYPFVIIPFNDDSKAVFHSLALMVQKDLTLENNTNIVVYGFEGPRKNGSLNIWFAIYNNAHPKQNTAKQLFFTIVNGEINYALFDFNKKNKIDEITIQPDQFEYSKLIEFYREYRKVILEDSLSNLPIETNHMGEKEEIITTLNTILYGPPGTGKTYKTKEVAVKIIEVNE